MSLLDGPLNVLGQRSTGEAVRTQNGEFCAYVFVFFHICCLCLLCVANGGLGDGISFTAAGTRADNANAGEF